MHPNQTLTSQKLTWSCHEKHHFSHVIAVSLKCQVLFGARGCTDLHRKTSPAPTFLRSPACRRWRWWAARFPRRTRAAGSAARRTRDCWPSPPSARRSGRTPRAGSAAGPGAPGCTRPPAPGSAPRPCQCPARSGPSPWGVTLGIYRLLVLVSAAFSRQLLRLLTGRARAVWVCPAAYSPH